MPSESFMSELKSWSAPFRYADFAEETHFKRQPLDMNNNNEDYQKQQQMELLGWLKSIPKVELHAHLNGSIRISTLLELAKCLGDKGVIDFSQAEQVILNDDLSYSEAFKLFDLIHVVTTDDTALMRIAKEVVEDFASENVVYLELRTTPKRNDSMGMSKRSYMEAVIRGLKAVTAVDVYFCPGSEQPTGNRYPCDGLKRKKIFVRLLLSIDRRESAASAMETVNLALEMRDIGVVGIDLSGNPVEGEWATFVEALEYARKQGLKISLHCGEVPNRAEIRGMIDFHPDRIGHACCLDEEEFKLLKALNIPVEICLTSNIRSGTVSSIDVHHFADLHRDKHPIVLCTDDAGVFSTSLSGEYHLAASAFGLGKREVYRHSADAIEFIFADDGVKEELRRTFAASAALEV